MEPGGNCLFSKINEKDLHGGMVSKVRLKDFWGSPSEWRKGNWVLIPLLQMQSAYSSCPNSAFVGIAPRVKRSKTSVSMNAHTPNAVF